MFVDPLRMIDDPQILAPSTWFLDLGTARMACLHCVTRTRTFDSANTRSPFGSVCVASGICCVGAGTSGTLFP